MAVRSRVGDILLKGGLLDDLQLRSALAHQERWGGRLTHAAIELGLADEDDIAAAISLALGIQRVSLGGLVKDPAAMARVPVAFAESRAVFPVAMKDHNKSILLAMADPTDLQIIDEAAAVARARVLPATAGEHEIAHAIAKHYRHIDKPLPERRARSAVQRSQRHNSEDNLAPASSAVPYPSASTQEFEFSAESLSAAPTAGDMLEEMLAASGGSDWTAEERARLAALVENQGKGSQIVRTLLELLVEKGYVQRSALDAWARGEPLPPLPQLRVRTR